MVNCFEKETAPLSDYENRVLLPIMVKSLQRHKGRENAVSNRQMMEGLEAKGYAVGSSARVRKLINRIRVEGLIDCLMATSCGYYITNDVNEMKSYIESLRGREEAICEVRKAMETQLNTMIDGNTQ